MRAAKTITPSFPGKKHILPTSQPLSLCEICNSLHYFLSLQVIPTFFSSEINHLHYRAKRTHAHAHTDRHGDTCAPLGSQEGLRLIKDTGADHLLQR